MEKHLNKERVLAIGNLKNLVKEAKVGLEEDFEQIFLDAVMVLLPEKIVNEIEGSWTSVMDYDETEMEGREVVETNSHFDEIFVMTREEVDEGEFAYVIWVKV